MSFPSKRNTAFTLVVMCNALALSAVDLARKRGHLFSSLPLFVTFDGGLSPSKIAAAASTVAPRETFVWGASPGNLRAWQAAAPHASLSFYMPYSRAPAASMGFDLAFFQAHHPDWVLYGCDRTTVAFWDGQTAKSGSVPLDFTNPAVVEWQMRNQSVPARSLGYDAMAFDNFGGGARQGANSGRACGVWVEAGEGAGGDGAGEEAEEKTEEETEEETEAGKKRTAKSGSHSTHNINRSRNRSHSRSRSGRVWSYRFNQSSSTFDTSQGNAFREVSVEWLERASKLMKVLVPGMGIVPNQAIGPSGWGRGPLGARVAAASTGMLSERGFTGWANGPVTETELLDEYAWMAALEKQNTSYYSINEVPGNMVSDAWAEWVIGAFLVGAQPHSSLWLGLIQGYGGFSYSHPGLGVPVGTPLGANFTVVEPCNASLGARDELGVRLPRNASSLRVEAGPGPGPGLGLGNLLLRNYTNGIALVNPTLSSHHVDVGAGRAFHSLTGHATAGGVIEMGAQSALVLVYA